MATTTPLKDFYGKIIGYVDIEANGDKTLKDFTGKILGRYHKASNTTRDFYGRIVAQGDCLTMLLK